MITRAPARVARRAVAAAMPVEPVTMMILPSKPLL